MSRGLFITSTGTDVGKTYVTALIIKKLRECGYNAGYYKAAISGADSIAVSDAGYVNKMASIGQREESLVSYLYKKAVSPHLAAKAEGPPIELDKICADYSDVKNLFDYVAVEGSGGIVCPLRWDGQHILLEDVVKALNLSAVVVADAGLGTINATVLTCEYLKMRNIALKGVILNHYQDLEMQRDNKIMIEELCQTSVVALVKKGDRNINIDKRKLVELFG